jgi:HSP20 family protein
MMRPNFCNNPGIYLIYSNIEQSERSETMADIEIKEKQTSSPSRRMREWPSFFSGPFGWGRYGMLRRMADEMDRAFRAWPDVSQFGDSEWPAIDVYEEDSNLKIRADLPGMKPEDVKIEVTEDGITLSGERRQEKEENREGYYFSERSYGSFRRTVPLPEGSDIEKAKAEYHDGELQVLVPMPKNAKQHRQIPISAET